MSQTLTLRELAEEAVALDAILAEHDGELTPELEPVLDDLAARLAAKADDFGAYLRDLEARAEVIAEEQARLKDRRAALDERAQWLKRAGAAALERMGSKKVQGAFFTLALQANPPAVRCDVPEDELLDTLPAACIRVVPERRELDRGAIRDALKRGETLRGVSLQVTTSLRVR